MKDETAAFLLAVLFRSFEGPLRLKMFRMGEIFRFLKNDIAVCLFDMITLIRISDFDKFALCRI